MSDMELFPEIPRVVTRTHEYTWERYPVLRPLNIEIGKFDSNYDYIRIEISKDAKVFVVGYGFKTQWTDRNELAQDNETSWVEADTDEVIIEGFVACAATPQSMNGYAAPILHIMRDVTDVDSSLAVRLDDIQKLYLYPENATRVKAMQQNAWVDGNTYHTNSGEITFKSDEMDAFVESYWPEPELVYEKQ